MPALVILLIAAFILAGLDIAATEWGTDSRPGFGDDHAR